MNRLRQLEECGQALWLDDLARSLVETGELQRLISRDGLKGITSNPSIFGKAIGESDEYAGLIKQFLNTSDQRVFSIYEHLAIADIQASADILLPVYQRTKGRDGYISLECSPYVAHDTGATVTEALRLWNAVGRRNLMVKVPATPAGIPAIRALIGRGLNINVTLLFSVAVYTRVVEAYVAGLEVFAEAGGDLSLIGSVASMFVSRIDTAVEHKLDQATTKPAANPHRDTVAIANGKLAYSRYKELFAGPRWEKLAGLGARTQRLLWASTSTKNRDQRDTMYVEALIGRDTVDTMPPATMDAFRDHGEVRPDAVEQDIGDASSVLAEIEQYGVALDEITADLVTDGVRQFSDAFDHMLAAVARRRRILAEGERPPLAIGAGSPALQTAFDAEMEHWRGGGLIRRLWAGDKSLWTGATEGQWCGWLTVVEKELAGVDRLEAFATKIAQRGFANIVLLGMGGSSLGAEVLGESFSRQPGWSHLHVLDSTDPAQIAAVERAVDLDNTLFIVSSKSGSTLEPNILMEYFLERVGMVLGEADAGDQFVAVTDAGSALERRAEQRRFAGVFHGVPSIGGRYSVLSKFGLVPAAAMGLDVRRLLQTAQRMVYSCGSDVPPAENPGVQLGVAIGTAAARFGRDKVTVVASPSIAGLGNWLEQLLAESTGKRGRGLIPVVGEALAPPEHYGDDRFFIYIELDGHADLEQRRAMAAIESAGHPVARVVVADAWHLGQEFFRFEVATAVAGAIIGVDPFDQPDVEASKVKTRALLEQFEKARELPRQQPLISEDGLALYADPRDAAALGPQTSVAAYLRSHFARLRAGDYVALLAYIERNEAHTRALNAIRVRIRDRTRGATCLGFGPAFQHSTGQVYKGGPNTGVFLQITCGDQADLDVPGRDYSFGIVKSAQARGDLRVLVERGRRVLRVHLENVELGLRRLSSAVDAAFE